ncbi:MAG: nuclear transport factor 2 family protein, partial [Betaproteobacteria bacterium]|nr:nuclear transport factor 2 family protein [Betaproteobacteria bacterium]
MRHRKSMPSAATSTGSCAARTGAGASPSASWKRKRRARKNPSAPRRAEMTDIERRLQYLEDEQAILDTLYGYGHGLDYGHEDAWIDCWTEDAVLDWPGRALMRGHAELRAGFRKHTHAPQAWHKHLLVEPRIVIE